MNDRRTSQEKRMRWRHSVVSRARERGDNRPAPQILEEEQKRSDAIRQAFLEARNDPQRAEVVILNGHHYPTADLHEGEVLLQARSYIHPRLRPF